VSPANAPPRHAPVRQLVVIAAIMLVPVLLIGLVLGGSYRSEATRRGLVQGRDEAVLMAQSAIEPFLNGQPLSKGLTPTELTRMHRLAADVVRSGSVQRLRLRDLQGNVIFSDDGSGFHDAIEDEALDAAHGHVVVRLTHLNSDSVDRGKVKGLSVEIYLPLYVGSATNRVGVLEVYLPYTPISRDVNAGIHTLYRNLAIGLALLYLILLAISLWVSRRLRRQVKVNTYLSEHDLLTNLPNRALFLRMASAELTLARRHGRPTTIAIIDLDRFKDVNDTLGHENGDLLLTMIGDRLRTHLRAPDAVARFGGDEFGVVLSDLGEPTDVLTRLREVIQGELEVGGLPLSIEASIGFVVSPDDGSSVEELLQRADVAMYVAKTTRTSVVRYDETQHQFDPSKLTLVTELRHAIASNQLVLHYQPKVLAGAGVVNGVEALVRWQHPTLGLLYPDRFIPLVEQTDLIDELTDWVLQRALSDLTTFGPRFETLQMSVNVSTRNLGRAEFARQVTQHLADVGVDPSRLTVEVTETALMADPERAAASLIEMSQAGVRISIDDFGSGQTSLGLLANLPIAELKIDRSFIQDIHTHPAHSAIVRSMVELGHQLDLVVVAEGVETSEELRVVVTTGCDLVQGYFYARPMPSDQLSSWLEQRAVSAAI
jgi:diguanylate cyclase (GGDEF)-like protein